MRRAARTSPAPKRPHHLTGRRSNNPGGRPKRLPGEWRSRNYARCLWHRCKAAAKRKGLPFDLTPEFVERLVAPMVCSVTGLRLIVSPAGERGPLLPSIDQVEAGAGYVQSNVRLVAWIYNRARGGGTDEDVLRMALALINQSAMKSII